jgi:hypothetical protein
VSAEYLSWWIRDSRLPPLVTTSPAGTPRASAGVIGADNTTIVFGGNDLDNEERSGGRLTFGLWLNCERTIGLESTTFFLAERTVGFTGTSSGLPILARPFFDPTIGANGAENAELVAFPGVLAGTIRVDSTSRLWGTELNVRANAWRGCYWHLDYLAGFRYMGLDENLSVTENLNVLSGASAGSRINVVDAFSTHNNFYGGQLGLDLEWQRGRWSVDLLGKVALGDTHEVVRINGNTQFITSTMSVVQPGGLLALPTNIGRFSRERFGVLPEAGIKLGYQINPHWRAFVGYSFLYLNDVARTGQQIDRVVNPTQLPSILGPGMLRGPARPAFTNTGSDFWAQGVSVGLEWKY